MANYSGRITQVVPFSKDTSTLNIKQQENLEGTGRLKKLA